MAWWDEVKLRVPHPVEVDSLSFDKENPRYTSEKGLPHTTDKEIIRFLFETSDLGELLQSIAGSGYIDIEPMIVLGKGEHLIVLEGNRRLAALKLLKNPDLAAACEIATPAIVAAKRETLHVVSVYRVKERRDAREFIGFKHINGAHAWDSLAKAKYAADWLRDEIKRKTPGASLQSIANRMGDRHATLLRMVHGVYVLEQAERNKLFSMANREQGRQFAFSHLYTALTRPGVRDYLGLAQETRSAEPTENPVPPVHYRQLKQLMVWLYGDEDTPAVVQSQNPHVKQLSEVLEHPKARKILMESRNLQKAYAEVDTPQRQFEHRLVEAHSALESSASKVFSYDGNDKTLLEIAGEIFSNAETILSVMKQKASAGK